VSFDQAREHEVETENPMSGILSVTPPKPKARLQLTVQRAHAQSEPFISGYRTPSILKGRPGAAELESENT
jgi:hypothetical protein